MVTFNSPQRNLADLYTSAKLVDTSRSAVWLISFAWAPTVTADSHSVASVRRRVRHLLVGLRAVWQEVVEITPPPHPPLIICRNV